MRGLEPPLLKKLVPKTSASTNSATCASTGFNWTSNQAGVTPSAPPVFRKQETRESEGTIPTRVVNVSPSRAY